MKIILNLADIPPSARWNPGINPNEFRAHVSRDGRACADDMIFLTPDGVTFAHPVNRVMNEHAPTRASSAACLMTGPNWCRVIIPARSHWETPEIYDGEVVHPSAVAGYES